MDMNMNMDVDVDVYVDGVKHLFISACDAHV